MLANGMDYFIFSLILGFGALIGAYNMAFQGATQYWGRELSGAPDKEEIVQQKMAEGISEPEARGFAMGFTTGNSGAQDAITPRGQTIRNLLFFGILLFALIGGWIFFTWYVGIGAFVALFIVTAILKMIFPSDRSEFFRKKIRNQLYHRCERHRADGDRLKVEACSYFLEKLDEHG